MKILFSAIAMSLTAAAAYASPVPAIVPYSGSFDEATIAAEDGLPAGDYDTLGGLEQVGLFRLVEGANTFSGSINAPTDTADVFLIEILAGFQLVGATLDWATNLPSIQAPNIFNVPSGFLAQSTSGANAPIWTVEESDDTPTIFQLENIEANMVGSTFDVGPAQYTAPAFDPRGPGVYSNLFNGQTTCGFTYVPANPGVSPQCVSGLDYTLTFNVERTEEPPVNPVPLPASLPLLLAGFGGLALLRRRQKS
ncbi:putative secreted protein [Litoreibacter ponti]|uniref:Putative secreted protein n=1 Tax=Litoreibacter ponti TaxID=1510457 RepID=A0A2T6BIR9_9RHOB|nr:VPLPA-CTERM sorting domain-containing protein [Litoreibacter ponti]PTX55946.1 putative secreted protein [Litoreibacter ponti]